MAFRETLILFARPPRPGRVKTRLAPALGAEGAAGLYRAFLLDAARLAGEVRAARPSVGLAAEWALEEGEGLEGLPLGEWLPGPFLHRVQSGSGLGPRMAAALGRALAGGAAAVLIGSDFPDLPPRVPLRALAGLAGPEASPRAALGPAEDGGYYLIGLNRPQGEIFADIPWGTDEVYTKTVMKMKNLNMKVEVMDQWRDVDSPEDLEALRQRLAGAPGEAAPHTRAWLRGR